VQAESLVTKGEYTDAVALATRMLAVSDPERRSRASDLLSTAYTLQGSSALNARQFSQAKASLMAALDLRAPSGSNPGLTGLGLNFAYLSHEEEAPNDPRAYNDVYDVIQKLSSLETDRESALSIRANLVEASLTTGRHDDAVRLGRELIADPGLNPIMSLNMRFIVYTALVLDGKPSDAAREDLRAHYQRQKGFRNEWGYAGTRAYIERSQIPDSDKTQLLLLLRQIETPTPAGR
jgi:hypothetical protein